MFCHSSLQLNQIILSHRCLLSFWKERTYKPISVVEQMVVHFVLENSLEYHDSSEDENSNAEEDQADGLSLKYSPRLV